MEKPIVMKFGGSSVTHPPALHRLAQLVQRRMDQGLLVVVSAMSGVTDRLERLVLHAMDGNERGRKRELKELRLFHAGQVEGLGLPSEYALLGVNHLLDDLEALTSRRAWKMQKFRDRVLSYGERLSSLIIYEMLRHRLGSVTRINAFQLVVTDDHYGSAQPLLDETRQQLDARVAPLLKPGRVILTQGFLGHTADGEITTLGRGGSDYSATLLARLLGAREVWIWTDVHGVLGADPRVIPQPRRLSRVARRQADLMARLGAKVLHPRSIEAMANDECPLYVANSFFPDHPGTLVHGEPDSNIFAVAGREVNFRLERDPHGCWLARAEDALFPDLVLDRNHLFACSQGMTLIEQLSDNSSPTLALLGILCPGTRRKRLLEELAHSYREASLTVIFAAYEADNLPCFLVIQPQDYNKAMQIAYQKGEHLALHAIHEEAAAG